ncbi:MAG: hypothetical protein V5A55_10935 [Halovenus sp.]
MEFRLRKGILSGGIAFVATYILVLVLSLFLPLGTFRSVVGFDLYHALFYDAHNPLAILGIIGSNLFTLTDSLFVFVVLVVPPIILFSQAHELADGDAPLPVALQQSVSMAAGYTPLALVGVVLVVNLTGTLDLLFTAVFYPVGFGLLGGLVASMR